MSGPSRFAIRRSSWVAPLLVLFSATKDRSWAEVSSDAIRLQFGWHRLEVPRSDIRYVHRVRWPWYAGLGWRSNLRTVVGYVGSYEGVVEFAVDPPVKTRLVGIPINLERLYVSLEDPDGFLATLRDA